MRLLSSFLLLTLTAISLSGCLASKMADALAAHQQTISQTARSRMPTAKKLDVVAETYVQVLDEALRFSSAKKAIKHVNTFSQQNEKELESIFQEIGDWSGNLSTAESLLLAGRLATKPYTRQLVDLVPKFKRKVNRRIQTFRFLSKLTKLVSLDKLIDKAMQ